MNLLGQQKLCNLQQLKMSYTMPKSIRKSKNRYFYHIFVSPGDAPEAITLNVVRMESAHLTITVSEIQRDICEKIVILSYPLHSSEYRHPLWDGKIRMVSLPDGEKISKICLFVLTWSTNVMDRRTDGRTDRHCMTAKTALASHRAVKT